MNRRRRVAGLTAIFAAGLVWSCGPRRIQELERPGQVLTVLLPDAESGTVGRATVSNPSGTTDLAAARESTTASAGQPPAPVVVMSEADVQAVFGDALAALPPAPRHVTLYFRFDSDELTDESRALVPEILQAVRDQPVPDIVVVGHTDTTGSTAFNFDLGLKRANAVRNILVQAGLDAPSLEVMTLGEADLLIPTPDEVPEPRNRRVEVVVR
jgi:outer membrane protein OmpA-like peptidoglycan-associated protein